MEIPLSVETEDLNRWWDNFHSALRLCTLTAALTMKARDKNLLPGKNMLPDCKWLLPSKKLHGTWNHSACTLPSNVRTHYIISEWIIHLKWEQDKNHCNTEHLMWKDPGPKQNSNNTLYITPATLITKAWRDPHRARLVYSGHTRKGWSCSWYQPTQLCRTRFSRTAYNAPLP